MGATEPAKRLGRACGLLQCAAVDESVPRGEASGHRAGKEPRSGRADAADERVDLGAEALGLTVEIGGGLDDLG